MKAFTFGLSALCVLAQLPFLGLWIVNKSSGPGSMALVLPAIICAALWFAGGITNAVLLVIGVVKTVARKTRWTPQTKVLGVLTVIWGALTTFFQVTS